MIMAVPKNSAKNGFMVYGDLLLEIGNWFQVNDSPFEEPAPPWRGG
jgi:hypothetical protein